MPLLQPPPIQAIVDFLGAVESDSDVLGKALSTTPARFLVSDSPIDWETAGLPEVVFQALDTISNSIYALAKASATTKLEESLKSALNSLIERDRARVAEGALAAQMLPQSLYSSQIRGQLAAKESTQDQNFHTRAVEQEETRQQMAEHREAVTEARCQHRGAVKT
ncbi:hypothetical protein FS749_010460 [Ceratobasidium sp. UAMH 11750]|nr:hypothetical protein FS749_010460 [Ceratobasidium sp. UAMH 11750]